MNPSATTHFLKWNFIQLNDDCGQKHERRSRLGFFLNQLTNSAWSVTYAWSVWTELHSCLMKTSQNITAFIFFSFILILKWSQNWQKNNDRKKEVDQAQTSTKVHNSCTIDVSCPWCCTTSRSKEAVVLHKDSGPVPGNSKKDVVVHALASLSQDDGKFPGEKKPSLIFSS